uniref:ATP synthase subunit e, mitochondrial n=1 Tax=Caenorhabditis tropicalis TaxID=1561998 RepID=A0A1I7U582_9PELO
MGTFTATYFLKTAFWDKRGLWTATLAVAYFARCWENAGYHKAEMMKGQSRMYADRVKQLPQHADAWKY